MACVIAVFWLCFTLFRIFLVDWTILPPPPLKFNPFHNLYGLFISGVLVALRGLDVYYSFFLVAQKAVNLIKIV